MRIAHIVADGRPGGGTTVVLGLVDDMVRQGGHSIAVVSQPDSYLEREIRRRGVDFVGCNLFTGWLDPTPPWRLVRALGSRRFDLSHLHGLRAAHHAVRWPLRPRLGRLVYTIHGLHQLHASWTTRVLANVAERHVMKIADAPVFVSHADLESARSWSLLPPNETAAVIWNGIEIGAVQAHARQQRDIDAVFIGRHVVPKRPVLAARVLAALATNGRRCVMVGGGPLEQECRKTLSMTRGGATVQLLGELARQETLDVLASSRVLVMPSAWEGLPILPMEAMVLGVPVIASRLPGIAEVLGADAGILVAPDDCLGFEQAAESVLTRADLEQSLRSAGARRVRECFQRSQTSARYCHVYDRLLSAAAGGPRCGS